MSKTILEDLRQPNGKENPWLIQFVKEYNSEENLEFKKLPFLLSKGKQNNKTFSFHFTSHPNTFSSSLELAYNFGILDCSKLGDTSLCQSKFQIAKYPTFILFKAAKSISGGPVSMIDDNWYEIFYTSRVSVDDLASFTKSNAHSTVRTLTTLSADFISAELASQQKVAFFIDFFAPVSFFVFF